MAIAVAALSGDSRALAGRSGVESFGTDALIAIPVEAGERHQQLAVIDPKRKTIGIYHIELSTGVISLKSVRNINWDLQLLEYNGVAPLPQELRAQFEQSLP